MSLCMHLIILLSAWAESLGRGSSQIDEVGKRLPMARLLNYDCFASI